ncbi:MAG: hypothetical protein ABTQ32_01825 [Myxococcaceae bacterium]
MPSITVKRGVQFRPDLFAKSDRNPWFDAVGKELETRGVSLKIGEGASAKVVKDGASLKAAMKELQAQATAANQPLRAYVADLVQAMDDVVVGGKVKPGDVFDFSKGSGLAKALGMDDTNRSNYAATTTEFGKAAKLKPEASLAIDGVTLQIVEPQVIDLSTVPHMSTETFKNAPVTYGRDGEEVEDTRVITGLTKDETVALANNALNDLQRPKAVAGLTVGVVPLEEMSWESDAHALRRANPYVSFTLDTRSYEVNPNNGQPRVAIGRDFFFDTFMAKKDLKTGKLTKDLQKAELMYRTRIRYGSDKDPFAGTRVLIGMKEGTAIDASGTKHARKIDSRTDSANQEIFDTLTNSAATGKLGQAWGSWSANNVAPAAASVYRAAVQKGITDNAGGETGVLALEPGAVARQIRGRFHLDETDQSALVSSFQQAGEPRIKELSDLIAAAPDWAASNGQPSKAELSAKAAGLLDRSAIVGAATEGLKKLDPTLTVDKALIDRLWPGQPISSKQDAKLQRVVADAIRGQYDGFAENVDQLQRNIGGNTDRTVRDAGGANDVRDFLRTKAAVSRFMSAAERASGSGVTVGNAASYVAYAKKVVDMPEGKDKTNLLQSMGVGVNQLKDMTEASFTSPVKVNGELVKQQTFGGFIKEFDAQLAGPNKDAFLAELGKALGNKAPALANATDKAKVAGDIRKNLVAAHAEVLHRMVEGAAGWGQAVWFNNYRQEALNINPQSWNFIIGSMDYTEFYDAKTGQGLSFQDRVSRKPLDGAKMTGAMISNDIQIELEAEAGYTSAIRRAQYALNGAAAGLMMDYALSKGTPGLTAGDAAGFEKWFATQVAKTGAPKQAFIDELNAFAKSKGSAIDYNRVLRPLDEQEKAIRVLTGFAAKKNPQLNVSDRAAVESWYRQQSNQGESELNAFLTEVAQYAADTKSELPLSPELLKTLDFKPFAGTNVGQPVTGHASLVDDLTIAEEVWTMVKKAQQDLSAARGAEVQRVLKDNNLNGKGWDPPTSAKGDYAIDYALR